MPRSVASSGDCFHHSKNPHLIGWSICLTHKSISSGKNCSVETNVQQNKETKDMGGITEDGIESGRALGVRQILMCSEMVRQL